MSNLRPPDLVTCWRDVRGGAVELVEQGDGGVVVRASNRPAPPTKAETYTGLYAIGRRLDDVAAEEDAGVRERGESSWAKAYSGRSASLGWRRCFREILRVRARGASRAPACAVAARGARKRRGARDAPPACGARARSPADRSRRLGRRRAPFARPPPTHAQVRLRATDSAGRPPRGDDHARS